MRDLLQRLNCQVYVNANQRESITKSDLEHKKRELAAVSTHIVQENEKMTAILKDIKYYVSLIKSEKDNQLNYAIKLFNS